MTERHVCTLPGTWISWTLHPFNWPSAAKTYSEWTKNVSRDLKHAMNICSSHVMLFAIGPLKTDKWLLVQVSAQFSAIMSGNRLRAMLENPEFCSSLSSFSNNVLNYNNGSSNFPNANVYNRYYNYSETNIDSVKSSPNSSCDTQANRNSHRDSNLKANYIDYANTTGVVTATTTKTSSSDSSSDGEL